MTRVARMRVVFSRFLLVLAAIAFGWGQETPPEGNAQRVAPVEPNRRDPATLTIVNPHHDDIPEERVRVLFLVTCRVVAAEFHRSVDDVKLPVTLIVEQGDDEHFSIDESGHLILQLNRWNEVKFVDALIKGAIQQLAPLQTRQRIVADIVRRSDQIAPISANALPGATTPTRNLDTTCISAAREESCRPDPRTVNDVPAGHQASRRGQRPD